MKKDENVIYGMIVLLAMMFVLVVIGYFLGQDSMKSTISEIQKDNNQQIKDIVKLEIENGCYEYALELNLTGHQVIEVCEVN